MQSDTNLIEEFRGAMAEKGIVTVDGIIADGKIHRVHVEGDRKSQRNGWYALHIDGKPNGVFGCNKRYGTDCKFTWSGKAAKPFTVEERSAFRARNVRQRAERVAAEVAARAEAATRAVSIWESSAICTEHPYLTRKGVRSHGLRVGVWEKVDQGTGEVRVITNQALLVPIRDAAKRIHSLQAIFPGKVLFGRDKDYLTGGAKHGLFYSIGKPQAGPDGRPVILIGEGFATVASAHEATEHAAIVAFDAGNLLPVATVIRKKFPMAVIVLLADNDQWTYGNPGLTKATAAAYAVGGILAVPPFAVDEPDKPTDFNDFQAMCGQETVRAVLDAVIQQGLSHFKSGTISASGDELMAGAQEARVDYLDSEQVEMSLVCPQPINAPMYSEDAIAMQFVERASSFRWSPGIGWMVDNGITWRHDDLMRRFDLARRVCRAVASVCEVKSESEAKRIASIKTVSATVTLAQSDPRMVVAIADWDADPMLLNTPGGVVDLRTGHVRPRGVEFVTQATAVAPDFFAKCPAWIQFLHEVFCGDASMIEFMQRSMGYWLSGSVREQVIHFFYGQGAYSA